MIDPAMRQPRRGRNSTSAPTSTLVDWFCSSSVWVWSRSGLRYHSSRPRSGPAITEPSHTATSSIVAGRAASRCVTQYRVLSSPFWSGRLSSCATVICRNTRSVPARA